MLPDSESTAQDSPRRWREKERKAWLLGKLRAAPSVILGNALKGIVFAAVGGLIGYLVGALRGLVIGAIVAFVVQLALF